MLMSASARSGTPVTPSDSTVLDFAGLWVGTTGSVVIKHTEGGVDVTYANVPVGFLQVVGVRVMAATTASNIVAVNW